MISHKFVRRIIAPNEILQHGYSDFTGQFNPKEFEQVEGPLPDNYLLIKPEGLIYEEGIGLRSRTLWEKILKRG